MVNETASAWADTADAWLPEARRRRPVLRFVVELVVVVLAGAGGYLLGMQRHDGQPAPQSTAVPGPSLQPYEASQVALNRAKFSGDLVPLAQPWLAEMGRCRTDTDVEGPQLPPDETKHVLCRVGGVSVHFSLFKSAQALSQERTYREGLYLTSGALAPGAGQPGRKTGGVSHAQGRYVEYALKGTNGKPPLCGIWWNRDNSQAALLLEALCQEDLGGSWAPLRDLWQRYS